MDSIRDTQLKEWFQAGEYSRIVDSVNANDRSPTYRALLLKGKSLLKLGLNDEAQQTFFSGIQHYPRVAEFDHQIGCILRAEGGQAAKAEAHFVSAIHKSPTRCKSFYQLMRLRRLRPNEDLSNKLLRLSLDEAAPKNDRLCAKFWYGEILYHAGLYEQGFEFIRSGNESIKCELHPRRCEYPLDIAQSFQAIDTLSSGEKNQEIQPLFIMGLPRSGKSLLEAQLSKDASVKGGGEAGFLRRFFVDIKPDEEQEFQLTACDDWPFLRLSRKRSQHPIWRYVIDTHPKNLCRLSKLAESNLSCKIIFCKRNFLDLGLAQFSKKFAQGNQLHTYDLGTLGRAIARSEAVMDRWSQQRPDICKVIEYENLVSAPGEVLSMLGNWLGLGDSPSQAYLKTECHNQHIPKRHLFGWDVGVKENLSPSQIGVARPVETLLQELADSYRIEAEQIRESNPLHGEALT